MCKRGIAVKKDHLIPILMIAMICTIVIMTIPKVKETIIVANKDVFSNSETQNKLDYK